MVTKIISGGQTGVDQAALDIENSINVLNVAGSRASKDPAIYRLTATVLRAAFGIYG